VILILIALVWGAVSALSHIGGSLWSAATDIVEALTDLAFDVFGDLGIEDAAWYRVAVMLPVGVVLSALFALCVAMVYQGPVVVVGSVVLFVVCVALGIAADPNRRSGGDGGPKMPLNL
jgi:hypothetical protein